MLGRREAYLDNLEALSSDMERERLIREVGVTFCSAGSCRCGAGGKCTRTKAQMMASKDLRVSRSLEPPSSADLERAAVG